MTTTAPRPSRFRLGAIVAVLALPAVVVVVLVLVLTGGDDDDGSRVSVFPGATTLAASRATTITLRGEDVDVEAARSPASSARRIPGGGPNSPAAAAGRSRRRRRTRRAIA